VGGMRIGEHTAPRLRPRNIFFAALGVASLGLFGASLVVAFSTESTWAKWLLLSSPVLGVAGLVLNCWGLRRIGRGLDSEGDLIWLWPGLFSALISCLLSALFILS
jgi:hypothetical protein